MVLGLLLAAVPTLSAQASTEQASTIRLHMKGNQNKLELLSTSRVERRWRGAPLEAPPEFFVHVVDGNGRTLDRVPFSLPGPRRAAWVKGLGPVSDPNHERLVLIDVPDHGAAMAEIRLERELPDQVVRLGSVSTAEIRDHAQGSTPQAVTVRNAWISGPSANRFDICVLAAGYLASEEAQFDADVADFVQSLFQHEPFRHYRGYINVRSVFRSSNAHACLSPQQEINYGISFVNDNYQACGRIDWNNGQPANIPAANADAALAGFDPGGVIVFVHSWAIPNQIIYAGLGVFQSIAIATTNRVARPSPFVSSLRFPALAVHELGHSIGRLADEVVAPNLSCPGRPLPETPPATDFAEYNVTRFDDRRRWQYLWSQLPAQLQRGGMGCDGTETPGTGSCVLGNFCGVDFLTVPWSVYHARISCMMNLLDADFCPPCAEELTLQLNANIDPVDSPVPESTAVTILVGDQIDFSWQDRTAGASKSARWFVNGNLVTTAAPATTFARTGAQLGVGRHTIRVDVTDSTITGSIAGQFLVGLNRRGNLDGSRTWTVDVVTSLPPGSTLLSFPGMQGGYNSQLGRDVAVIGDWNKDGTPDIGVTSGAGVHAASGKTGAQLYLAPLSGSYIPHVGGVRDVDSFGNDWLLHAEERPFTPIKAYRHNYGQIGQWMPGNQPRELVPLGDITGDNIGDFASCSPDSIDTFSGAVTIGSGGLIYQLPAILPASWVVSRGDHRDGRAMQSLGYDDFNGNQRPDGDINGDGKAEFVTVAEDPHPGIRRFVRVYSVANPPFQLWEVEVEAIEHHWVATVGDIDQDGISDFLLASPTLSGNAGRVQVRSGYDGSVLRTHPGAFAGSKTGRGIAGIGDVDLDGRPDYAIARFGAANTELVEIRSGATGNILSTVAPAGVSNGFFGQGKAMASIGDINSDGIPDLAIGNGGEGNAGRVRVVSPVPATLTSPQTTISAANGGSQTFNIDMPDNFAGFGYIMAASLSGTAIPGIPYHSVRLPIVPDFLFTLGIEQSPFYTNPVGTLAAGTATATASVNVPSSLSPVLLGLRMHHIALFFDPANPATVVEVTNAVYADFN